MTDAKWYAAAPADDRYHEWVFDREVGGIVLAYCRWRNAMSATHFLGVELAVDDAIGYSEHDVFNAYTVVEIGETDGGWEIERTLPVLAFRGDLYEVVDDGAKNDFMKELV